MEEVKEPNLDEYIRNRYKKTIEYYWEASKSNKRWYKTTRSLTIILGALVTLIASLNSSEIIKEYDLIQLMFSIGTPILAASLTIIAGFAQSFQYGGAWQNMVLTAQQLQKEYDKYLVTDPVQRDYATESEKLNAYIIDETESFFERILGGIKRIAKPDNNNGDN